MSTPGWKEMIRIFGRIGCGIPQRAQNIRHAIAVIDIHLTAPCFDKEFFLFHSVVFHARNIDTTRRSIKLLIKGFVDIEADLMAAMPCQHRATPRL